MLDKARLEKKRKIEAAEGYVVFSSVGTSVVFAREGGGRDVVVVKNGEETFMRMGWRDWGPVSA